MKNELDERREKIERLIPDQGIRSILFDFDDQSSGFLSDRRKYIDYVKTTLSFFTLIAYKKFLLYKQRLEKMPTVDRTREISEYSNAMVRLYNMFDGCYSSGRLDFAIIENVILNLQVDASMKRKFCFLGK